MKLMELKERFTEGREQTKFSLNQFEKELIKWGYWATPRLGTEYPRFSTSIPLPPLTDRHRIHPISDDRALEIEKQIILMHKITPDLYALLMAKYAYRLPLKNEYDRNRILVRQGVLELFDMGKTEYASLLQTAKTSLMLMLYP